MDSGSRRQERPHPAGQSSAGSSPLDGQAHRESPGGDLRGVVHPYALEYSQEPGGARKHSPPAFHANGSPRHGMNSQGASPAKYVGEGSPAPGAASPGRQKLAQVQNVAAAVETGLRKQRDQLQAQLDRAAQREATLEARVGELEEKLLLEDSVWSELALDPRMTPEAMALQLRRANEMQMWAERAEHDERQARISAEAALNKLVRERDVAQQQLALAQAKLEEIMDTSSAAQDIRKLLSQSVSAVSSAGKDTLSGSNVPPIVPSDATKQDARAEGRQRLEAAMQDAYHRAGVHAALKQPRQRHLDERDIRHEPVSESLPYTPRALEVTNSLSNAQHNTAQHKAHPSPPFEIDGSGRLLVAQNFSPNGQEWSTDPPATDPWSGGERDPGGRGRHSIGMEAGGVRQLGTKTAIGNENHGALREPRMGAGGARPSPGLMLHPERSHTGVARLSVLGAAEQSAQAASGGSNGVSNSDGINGSQGPRSGPQQTAGAGAMRSSGPPPAWWRAAGTNSIDDASEHDAGTLTYGNENNEMTSDDTAPSVSDDAIGSSDDDLGGTAPSETPEVARDGGRVAPRDACAAGALGGNDIAGPRMGGPTNNASHPMHLRRPSREKNLNLLLQSSSPPSSFGQLLCSLPEAKPITQFPVPLDHTSSPPSSARKLSGWGTTSLSIPAFPGAVEESSDEEEDLTDCAGGAMRGSAAPSSTDSLIQGAPSGGYQRGGPKGVRLEPRGEISLSDVSPWPSANSSGALLTAWGGAGSGQSDEAAGIVTPLPSVSSAASSLAAGGMRACLHDVLPPPVLQPMSVSGMPDVSPWPSTTSFTDSHATSSRQVQGPLAASGVAGRVNMAPLSGNFVDMSPFPSASGPSAFGGGGHVKMGGAGIGEPAGGVSIAPISGSLVDVSPFPSSNRLPGPAAAERGGAASVLRQAADALSDGVGGGRGDYSPSPLLHGRTGAAKGVRGGSGHKTLLPNPSSHINMLPSPSSDALDETFGNNHSAAALASSSSDRQADDPPVSGIIFTPVAHQGAVPESTPRRAAGRSTASTPHAPHVQAQGADANESQPPPVSGIIFTPPQPASGGTASEGAVGKGRRDMEDHHDESTAGHDAALIAELVGRVGNPSSNTHLFEALKVLHEHLQASSAPKGSTSGPAAAIRQEVLASSRTTEQVVAGCAHGLSASADDSLVAESAIDVLAVLAADVAARQAIIGVLQREEAAAIAIARVLASFSPSSLSSCEWITQHHALMVVGNLAIDPVGRRIILAQEVIMQHLVRMLWVDTHHDAPNAVKALRFTTGALRSLVLDPRGKDLLLNGASAHSGAQVLSRISHLQVIVPLPLCRKACHVPGTFRDDDANNVAARLRLCMCEGATCDMTLRVRSCANASLPSVNLCAHTDVVDNITFWTNAGVEHRHKHCKVCRCPLEAPQKSASMTICSSSRSQTNP